MFSAPYIQKFRKGIDGSERVVCTYKLGRMLGKGAFAQVYEVEDTEKEQRFACKIVSKASLAKRSAQIKLMSEIKIHRGLMHPNIVRFVDWFEDQEYVYIILELCENRTLLDLLHIKKKFTEAEAARLLFELASAVHYLHSKLVLHRDLKLGNIFLAADGHVKLGDFGLAAQLTHAGEKKKSLCGTPNYIAPEVLDRGRGHSFEVDVWALGVILYTLLVGTPPFETAAAASTYERIKRGQFTFPEGAVPSAHARDLICSALSVDPAARPTLPAILAHPFLSYHSAGSAAIPATLLHSRVPLAPLHDEHENKENTHIQTRNAVQSASHAKSAKEIAYGFGRARAPAAVTKDEATCGRKEESPASEEREESAWLVKFADISGRLGLAYLLRDHSVGGLFRSKLVLDVELREGVLIDPSGQMLRFQCACVPTSVPGLATKVALLQSFRSHFLTNAPPARPFPNTELRFVKRWMRSEKQAVLFLFNREGVIQADFEDGSRLLLADNVRWLLYLEPGQAVGKTMPFERVLEMRRCSAAPQSLKPVLARLEHAHSLLSSLLRAPPLPHTS